MPVLLASLFEPLWVQFSALLPERPHPSAGLPPFAGLESPGLRARDRRLGPWL